MPSQSAGSQGLSVTRPPRMRRPPNPLTRICQVPPAEAMCMPSAVLPWLSVRSTRAERSKYWTARVVSPTSIPMIAWIDGLSDDLCSVRAS